MPRIDPGQPRPPIEAITHEGSLLAYVVSRSASSDQTAFITSDDASFQAGFVVYPEGSHIEAHVHVPVVRQIVGTAEMLFVRSGRCLVDIYTQERRLVATRELFAGDAVLTLGGGHGFRMLEPTVLFEIKQGPYSGEKEKERFRTSADGEPL